MRTCKKTCLWVHLFYNPFLNECINESVQGVQDCCSPFPISSSFPCSLSLSVSAFFFLSSDSRSNSLFYLGQTVQRSIRSVWKSGERALESKTVHVCGSSKSGHVREECEWCWACVSPQISDSQPCSPLPRRYKRTLDSQRTYITPNDAVFSTTLFFTLVATLSTRHSDIKQNMYITRPDILIWSSETHGVIASLRLCWII